MDPVNAYVKEMLAKSTDHANQTFYTDLQETLKSFEEAPELLSQMDAKDNVALMEEFSATMRYAPESANADMVSKAEA